MEPEFNSENWQQPQENQSQPSQPSPSYPYQPQKQSFLQQKWLNIKVSTWLQCLIIATVLSFAAVFVAPKFTKASSKQQLQQQQQDSYEYYTEEDYWNDFYDSEDYGYGYRD